MGIKDLWNIFSPFCERKPLYELEGKTLAVDLSGWVCEAQNISEYQVQPRMYLRNLYFRTCYLLLLGVNPVFVLEGKAPTLKYDTIASRNAVQFKGAKPKTDKIKTGKDRSRFNYTLKQCEEMLKYMGLTCITGKGEAEAMCAYLNEDGLVDGCISQDSDCFAYGAKRVYKNFSISQQGVHSSSGGAVDVYDIEKLKNANGFGRYKIIALALLCGSDYNDGVFGIGKDSAIKLFNQVSDDDILDKLRSWRKDVAQYDDLNKKINDKNICASCGHPGKLYSHNKVGCKGCNTNKGCDSSNFKEERLLIKNELNMREKALTDLNFPNEELIKEFLIRKDNVSALKIKWKQPNMRKFVTFTVKYLQWEEIYAFEKLLPILTRWQLLHYYYIEKELQNYNNPLGIIYPNYIKKCRNPKGIASYEIIWIDKDNFLKGLIPEEQLTEKDLEKMWSTIEPQHLVEKAYSSLVESYKQSKVKPKKQSKRKKNVDIENKLQNISLSEPKPKNQKTKRNNKKDIVKATIKDKQILVDSYFKRAVLNNIEKKINEETNEKLETNKQKINYGKICNSLSDSFDLNASQFGDENDLDISDIIEDIVHRTPPKYITEHLHDICYTVEEEKLRLNDEQNSSFFTNNLIENDLFEQTFNQCDSDTEEYDIDEEILSKVNIDCATVNKNDPLTVALNCSDSDDSFCTNYVPLMERLRNKEIK